MSEYIESKGTDCGEFSDCGSSGSCIYNNITNSNSFSPIPTDISITGSTPGSSGYNRIDTYNPFTDGIYTVSGPGISDLFDVSEKYITNLNYTPRETPYDIDEFENITTGDLPGDIKGLTNIEYRFNGKEFVPYIDIKIDSSVKGTAYEPSVNTHESVHAEQAGILPYIENTFRKLFAEGDATTVQEANHKYNITNPLYKKYESVVKSIYNIIGEGNINRGRDLFYDRIEKIKDFKGTLSYFKDRFKKGGHDAEDIYQAIVNPKKYDMQTYRPMAKPDIRITYGTNITYTPETDDIEDCLEDMKTADHETIQDDGFDTYKKKIAEQVQRGLINKINEIQDYTPKITDEIDEIINKLKQDFRNLRGNLN